MKIVQDNEVINTFIVTATVPDHLLGCLTSLRETVDLSKHRIILVVPPLKNMFMSHEWNLIKRICDVVIETKYNYGFGQSVNLGLAMVRSKYFTVIHDDLVFQQKGWWDICKKELDSDWKIMMVQPTETPVKFAPKDNGEITNIYCMVFKRKFIEEIGLFDERWYPAGPEDVDLLFRIRNADYHTCLTHKAIVVHKGSGTVGQYANYLWDRSKEYIEMKEKYGVDTLSKYDVIPIQLEEDILKQL